MVSGVGWGLTGRRRVCIKRNRPEGVKLITSARIIFLRLPEIRVRFSAPNAIVIRDAASTRKNALIRLPEMGAGLLVALLCGVRSAASCWTRRGRPAADGLPLNREAGRSRLCLRCAVWYGMLDAP